MLSTIQETPIIKPISDMKNIADHPILAHSASVLCDSHYHRAYDNVFKHDKLYRYFSGECFLHVRLLLSFWFLHRLLYSYIVWSLPMISGILIKDRWVNNMTFAVRNLLSMHFSFPVSPIVTFNGVFYRLNHSLIIYNQMKFKNLIGLIHLGCLTFCTDLYLSEGLTVCNTSHTRSAIRTFPQGKRFGYNQFHRDTFQGGIRIKVCKGVSQVRSNFSC